jgi:hypothetical protein
MVLPLQNREALRMEREEVLLCQKLILGTTESSRRNG